MYVNTFTYEGICLEYKYLFKNTQYFHDSLSSKTRYDSINSINQFLIMYSYFFDIIWLFGIMYVPKFWFSWFKNNISSRLSLLSRFCVYFWKQKRWKIIFLSTTQVIINYVSWSESQFPSFQVSKQLFWD